MKTVTTEYVNNVLSNAKGRFVHAVFIKKDGTKRPITFKVCANKAPNLVNYPNLWTVAENGTDARTLNSETVVEISYNKIKIVA